MDSVQYLFLDPSAERAQFGRSLGEISPFDAGIPLLDLSSDAIREIYYYRQHSFCKHIRRSNAGYIVTEFYIFTAVATGTAVGSAGCTVVDIEHFAVGTAGTVLKSPPVVVSTKIVDILGLESGRDPELCAFLIPGSILVTCENS